MSPQSQQRQHVYVQCEGWPGRSEHAQEINGIIASTGADVARMLGVKRITEKYGLSRWLCTDEMKYACIRAVGGNVESGPIEHVRKLYAHGRLIGDMFSPYTYRVGVGWGDTADVQTIADALQGVLEEHNYGVTSTRGKFIPRRVVVLDEAHSLYAPISACRGNLHNISVLVLRADMVTDDVAAALARELHAGVGHA